MSTDAIPTTDATPATNGVMPHSPDADPRPDLPRWEEGPNKLPLTIAWRECIRDIRWIEEQFHCDGFAEYEGKYVAVWDRKIVDSDADLLELRARLKQLPNDAGRRATVEYIEPPIVI